MDREIILVANNGNTVESFFYDPTSKEELSVTLESIQNETTLVFRDPSSLNNVLANKSSLMKGIHRLRLCIIYPLSDTKFTSEESKGNLGPNVLPLMEEWMSAFEAMPAQHPIKHIVFDMLCGQKLALNAVVELLKEGKQTILEKAAGPFTCSIQGYHLEDDKEWI